VNAKTKLGVASILWRDPTRRSLAKLSMDVSHERKENQKLESKLRAEDLNFDFEAESLQKRLLMYFETRFGYTTAKADLQNAYSKSKEVQCAIAKSGLLGLHSGNQELLPLVEHLANYEQFLLNNVVLAENPSEQLRHPRIIQLFSEQLKRGRGENVIIYLAARLRHHRRREKSERQKKIMTLGVYNPFLLVAARSWTAPACPMWMIPAKAAVAIINECAQCEEPITDAAYKQMIKREKLPAIPDGIFKQFISIKLKDKAGIALQKKFEEVTNMSIASFRRGGK